MKHPLKIGLSVLGISCLAAVAWAGGSTCSGHPDDAKATSTSAGHQCDGVKSEHASGERCTVGANQMVYSFAVPGAECEACQNIIQRTAMAQKGVSCAHVDLTTRTAYIVADKKMNQKAVMNAITKEGYKCTFKDSGQKVQAEFMKVMTAGAGGACCAKKDKEKV